MTHSLPEIKSASQHFTGTFPQSRGSHEWTDVEPLIEAHLNAGEFPLAEQQINQLPRAQADAWRVELFRHQWLTGVGQGSLRSLNQIQDDHLRSQQIVWLRENILSSGLDHRLPSAAPDSEANPAERGPKRTTAGMIKGNAKGTTTKQSGTSSGAWDPAAGGAVGQSGSVGGFPSGTAGSNPTVGNFQGGIAQQDFFPLINLITSTIAVDSWSINGGSGNLQAFPAGVFVDPSGLLQGRPYGTGRGRSLGSRIGLDGGSSHDWFQDQGNRDAQRTARLRKVSLTRLERAAQWKFARGQPLDETMLSLAGLTSIDFLVFDPRRKEILLIGPAGAWGTNAGGRRVSQHDGKPVLDLDDWVVCWRNACQQNGKFGCSIDPREENLVAARQFITQSRLKGAAWSEKLREALGQQDILVFGIDPTTRTAATLVYADYHMKRIAMGLEPSLPEVPDFLQRLPVHPPSDGGVDLARWWFALKDLDIATDERRELFSIDRLTLQILSETEWLNQEGQRQHTNASLPATAGFAADFTRHFDRFAEMYPVYQELRNVFLWATVANLIRRENMDRQVGWQQTFFGGSSPQRLGYPLQKYPQPARVDSIMNERQFRLRSGGKTLEGRTVGVSGGVDCQLSLKLASLPLAQLSDQPLVRQQAEQIPPLSDPQWWWD